MLTLSIAGWQMRVQVNREPRTRWAPARDYRAERQQQVLHLLYGASTPHR